MSQEYSCNTSVVVSCVCLSWGFFGACIVLQLVILHKRIYRCTLFAVLNYQRFIFQKGREGQMKIRANTFLRLETFNILQTILISQHIAVIFFQTDANRHPKVICEYVISKKSNKLIWEESRHFWICVPRETGGYISAASCWWSFTCLFQIPLKRKECW